MSALIPAGLLIEAMPPDKRQEQIERFIHEHPERYKKLAPVPTDREPLQVCENFDRVRLGEVLGAYRRKKHTGSDEP